MNFWTAERVFYPSVFRVLLGILLLVDAVVSISVTGFMFDERYNAFHSTNWLWEIVRGNYVVFYLAYILFLLSFILDIGGFLVKTILFLFTVAFDMLEPAVHTWGDMILSYTLLFFIFADSSKLFTFRKPQKSEIFEYLSKLAVWSIILHLFLIYFSNGYSKLMDTSWQNGYAVYFSFGQFHDFETSIFYQILKNEWMAKAINYFIIFFQISFPLFIVLKKMRMPFVLIGITLHLVMMWQFGLWKFELIVILLYGFLLTDQEWEKFLPNLSSIIKTKSKLIKVFGCKAYFQSDSGLSRENTTQQTDAFINSKE